MAVQQADKRKVCCMFSDPDANHAAENQDLEYLVDDIWTRHESVIYRCRKCGAYVLHHYEVVTFFNGWDNADIYETYKPIEDPTVDGEISKFPENVAIIKDTLTLWTHYQEMNWDQKRSWLWVR